MKSTLRISKAKFPPTGIFFVIMEPGAAGRISFFDSFAAYIEVD
jgi:hypothetical protein